MAPVRIPDPDFSRIGIDNSVPFNGRGQQWMDLAGRMNIGDSVAVETEAHAERLRQAICRTHGPKTAGVRRDGGRYRVWRLAGPEMPVAVQQGERVGASLVVEGQNGQGSVES